MARNFPLPSRWDEERVVRAVRAGRRKPREPVGVDELAQAVLRMIVRDFGDRPLDWDTASQALALAAYELKATALREIATQEKPRAGANRRG